jgi:hypothetical protein
MPVVSLYPLPTNKINPQQPSAVGDFFIMHPKSIVAMMILFARFYSTVKRSMAEISFGTWMA